ncbi:MAG: hypothetical protein ABSB70_05860 [Candidatus Velthaea sp.]
MPPARRSSAAHVTPRRARSAGLERGWLKATVLGALLGRCLQFSADSGIGASLVSGWPIAVQIGLGAVLGALVGALMAAPQAVLLSRRVPRAWAWIGVRAIAWSIALPALMLAGAWLASISGNGLGALVCALLVTFALIGAFVGSLEGVALAALLRMPPIRTSGWIPPPIASPAAPPCLQVRQ